MKKYSIKGLLLAAALISNACSFVEKKPGAEAIVLADESAISQCEKKGSSTAKVIQRVGFINRMEEVVSEELVALASNTALELGGDTLVPLGMIIDGQRKFDVYKCKK